MAMAKMQPSAPRDVLPGVHNPITDMVKEVANEPSVGLCFVQRHVYKAVPGLLALKDVHANTLFKSPWPIRPSLSVLLSSHGGSSRGRIRCSPSSSSVWRRSFPSVNASGKAEPIEELWEEYFADPFQWWDNRIDKRNPRSPDFKHKGTRNALWIDGWATPAWVKERLKLGTQGKLQFHVGNGARDSQDIAQSNRLPKNNNGRKSNVPTTAQECRHSGEGGRMGMERASTMNEAIAVMKTRLQQGLSLDSYMFVEVLKRCLKQKDLRATKEVHECIIESGMEQDVYVATNLLQVYIGCGRLQEARWVFDELLNKNIFSWTVMIGGYAHHNRAEDAMEVFRQMFQEDVQANEVTYLSILKAFITPSALKWGKEVHAHIKHDGLESDLRVGSALVHMYAKTGSIDDARLVFDRMEDRNIITWSAMIGGLADRGRGHEAYELFLQMQRDGFEPDAITCLSILNACASAGALEWVKEVHRHVLKARLWSDLRVVSALVHMYAKSGSIDDARLVFYRMEDRNVITWNTMIGGLADHGCEHEAYELFLQMQRGGCVPNVITYVSILNACASVGALEWVKVIHRHVLEAGLESELRVGNALVHSYAKSGSIDDAQLVFDRMEDRDVITWNMLIGGLADHGHEQKAYELFLQMQREGYVPNAITFVSILNACASEGALEQVKEVHRHVLELQLGSDLRVGSALVHSYVKSGSIKDARLVFDKMEDRNVITWSAMIGGLVDYRQRHQAYELFLRMQGEGCVPNAITYVSILNASAGPGALDWVKLVHRHVLEAGLESDLRVGSALVHMYAKSGSIDDARLIFDRMEDRDVITWTMLIGGLAQHGRGHEALELFRRMNAAGVKPDDRSFVSVLSACSHAGLIDEGRRLFSVMSQEYGIKPDALHCNCMVDLLGRGGYLEEAKRFVDTMPVEPDGATWGSLLGACRTYGNVELGEFAANQIFKLEPKDASPYVLLSNIYAAAGKWEEVSFVRTMMQERGVRKEPGRSWIEVDDKIHDFVVGDTSHPESKEIYAELDRLTEKIKAEGYIPDTRLVLQDIDEENKELALCSHSEKLAISFGMIHTPRRKPIFVYKNLRVCSDCHTATKFISKVTGREIVARDANRFHHFKDGVCSCGDYW